MTYPQVDIGAVCLPTETVDPRSLPETLFQYIDIGSVDKGLKQIVRSEPVIGSSAPTRARKVVHKGDILVCTVRPNLNTVAMVPGGLDGQIASTGFCVLRPNERLIDRRYLFFHTMTPGFVNHLVERVRGAHYPAVTDAVVKEALIPLPPLPEQRRIADILDQADALRRQRIEADHKADRILPALFIKMFGEPAGKPCRWPEVAVSDFVDRFEGGRSVAAKGQDVSSAKYRILKVSAVTWGEYRPEESKAVPIDYKPPESHLVRAGDLLFSRANTKELVGAVVYVHDTPPNVLLPDKLWRFVWRNPDEVDPLYVHSLFSHPSVRYELGKRSTGTSGSMQNVSMEKVLLMHVPLPPVDLQRQFGAFARRLRVLGSRRRKSSGRLERLFRNLLHRAFSGALSPSGRPMCLKDEHPDSEGT